MLIAGERLTRNDVTEVELVLVQTLRDLAEARESLLLSMEDRTRLEKEIEDLCDEQHRLNNLLKEKEKQLEQSMKAEEALVASVEASRTTHAQRQTEMVELVGAMRGALNLLQNDPDGRLSAEAKLAEALRTHPMLVAALTESALDF